jgi:putative inorganic carbon (HCO3(-)) transporter
LESSAGDRVSIWQDAFLLIQESPIIGSGFATYQFMSRVRLYKDTHNMYLKILVENGVIGIGLFLSMLIGLLGLGYRTFRNNTDPFVKSLGLGLAAMMTGVLVVNLFGDRWSYLQVNGVLWTLVGCVVRGNELAQDAAWEDAQHQEMALESGQELDGIPESMVRA